jgi:hypothetical protein
MYGQLLAVAAYTATTGDTDWTLLGEAEDAARRAGSGAPLTRPGRRRQAARQLRTGFTLR